MPESTPEPTQEPTPAPTPVPQAPPEKDFTSAGLSPESIVDPYQTYSYEQMVTEVGLLAEAYPELISVYSIGESVEGRNLVAFDFGHGEREVVLCSTMHACEHMATNALMYIVDQCCQGYRADESYGGVSYRDILDQVVFHVVPMLNPDGVTLAQFGYEAMKPETQEKLSEMGFGPWYGFAGWKSNVNGVDLNGNYPHKWGIRDEVTAPCEAGWCGPAPLSEPENRAMQDLLDRTDYHMLVSLHIRGEVVYWIDTDTTDLFSEHYPIAHRLAETFRYDLLGAEDVSDRGGYLVNTERIRTGKFCCTLELCPVGYGDPYPVSMFPRVVERIYPLFLAVGQEVLNMPEHTGHLPVEIPAPTEAPEETDAEEPPAEEAPGSEASPSGEAPGESEAAPPEETPGESEAVPPEETPEESEAAPSEETPGESEAAPSEETPEESEAEPTGETPEETEIAPPEEEDDENETDPAPAGD